MNTALLIYFVMQLDNIIGSLGFIVSFSIIASVIVLFFMSMFVLDDDTDSEAYITLSRWLKKIAPITLVSMLLLALIPSTNTAIYMVGGAGVVEVLQSEQAQEVGGKAYRLLMKKLDEELTED